MSTTDTAMAGQPGLRGANRTIVARGFPLAALVIFGTLFAQHVMSVDPAALRQAFADIAPWQWAASLGFAAISLWAVGTYDMLVHRLLRTGVSPARARMAGTRAVAVAQTLGFGAVTGAFVRWRCLPELSAMTIARLSVLVSLSFLVALAAVAAVVVPLSGLVPNGALWGVTGVAGLAALGFLARTAYQKGWIKTRLTPGAILALLGATLVDTAFAAAALWVLWPGVLSFEVLFAAYLVALGAGLVSNTPGGIGAFDLTLLALLPATNAAGATCALLAFRITYYLVPCCLTLITLVRPAMPTRPAKTQPLETHPEGALVIQNATTRKTDQGAALILQTPLGPVELANTGAQQASGTLPVYKCSARQARALTQNGWAALRVSQDATLNPHDWDTSGPHRRQLRRQLRAFEASNHVCRETQAFAPLGPVNAEWTRTHRRERGVSMGRFDPNYLRHQRVFAAFGPDGPVAFVSFHTTGDRWTLDLMRHRDDLPKGTMHALICAAIDSARMDGVTQLSLAATPDPCASAPLAARIHARAAGLRRFKASFAPTWRPLYLCAPSQTRLSLALAGLTFAIHRPPSLPNLAQTNDEDFSFDPLPSPCEARPSQ